VNEEESFFPEILTEGGDRSKRAPWDPPTSAPNPRRFLRRLLPGNNLIKPFTELTDEWP
jgi:hypothetical protein